MVKCFMQSRYSTLKILKTQKTYLNSVAMGEYPRYTLTEKGEEYVEMIRSNMVKDNNKKENPAKNVKTTPLPVKETRYGFYKCKGRIKGE